MLIRYKIIISFTLITTFITIIFSWYVYFYNALYRKELFENSLVSKAVLVSNIVLNEGISNDAIGELVRKGNLDNLYDEKILFVNEEGEILYTNVFEPDVLKKLSFILQKRKPVNGHFYADMDKYEVVVASYFRSNGQKIFALIAAHDLVGKSKLFNLSSVLILGNAFSFFIALFFAIFFSDGLLKPIQRIINRVNEITGSNLDLRLDEGNGKDELAQISITFNHLLERVEQVFISQKYFISHASHELRTPLASAMATLETTLIYDDEVNVIKTNIDKTLRELKKSADLTNGLLRLAKIDNEALVSFEFFRLDESLLNTIADVKTVYPEREIKYRILSIPETDTPFTCEGSRQLMEIALFNIIENACKYAGNNEVEVSLDFSLEKYCIKIADRGLGINIKDLPRIFEPLYRGSNVKEIRGHGLGLPLVKKIIEIHNGSIEIISSQGEGTTFFIRLPLKQG